MSDLELIRDGRHYDALKAQNDVAFYLGRRKRRPDRFWRSAAAPDG